MADRKLSALTELAATPADDDEVYIRDISEPAADESKRITIANLKAALTSIEGLTGLASDDQHVLDAEVRSAAVSDTAYGAGWNGVTTIAPSKNAVYDKIETLADGGITATSGTYTGNDSANRAIPHGLGRVPAMVIVYGGGFYGIFMPDSTTHWTWNIGSTDNGIYVYTAANSTNFYVGNASDYLKSQNNSGQAYFWVAFG